jgi:hypothetical protein
MSCRLICVDPAQAHEFWPHVAALIKAAMEKGRLSSYADVEHSVRNGTALLWLAWNGGSGGAVVRVVSNLLVSARGLAGLGAAAAPPGRGRSRRPR